MIQIDESLLEGKVECFGVIYLYENAINHKKYVGQTTKSVKERHQNHKWQKYNSYFHNALTKYGEDNFTLKVIDVAYSQEELDEKEIYWIKYYDSVKQGYNLTSGGGGMSGFKHSEETKEYLRQINLGENNPMFQKEFTPEMRKTWSDSHRGLFKGRKLTETQKEKIRKSKIGKYIVENNPMYGKHHTSETKDKIRNNKRTYSGSEHPQAVTYIQLDMNYNFLNEFSSGKDASEFSGCDRSDISKCCNGKIKQSKGFIWMYKEDYLKYMEEAEELVANE